MAFIGLDQSAKKRNPAFDLDFEERENEVVKPTPKQQSNIWEFEFEDRFKRDPENVELAGRVKYAVNQSIDFKNLIDWAYAIFLRDHNHSFTFPLPIHMQIMIGQPEITLIYRNNKVQIF